MRTKIAALLGNYELNIEISVKGWVRTRRDSKGGFSFLELNDGSCLSNIQIVADQSLPNYEREIKKLHPGCSVSVTGILAASKGGKQKVEVQAKNIEVLGNSDPEEYTIGKQKVSFEILRDIPHLRMRTNTFGAVTRVRNKLAWSVHDFFQKKGFLYINTPIITASDCEGAGELFRVTTLDPSKPGISSGEDADTSDFFGKSSYLTVSGQLELESFACSMGDVYNFGPTFRAENSNTSRHLAEFWMIEPEMAFADLIDNMDLAEQFLKHTIRTALNECGEDMEFFNKFIDKDLLSVLNHITGSDFARISYTEAIERLEKSGKKFDFPVKWGIDLQSEHERFLTEEDLKVPVIVYNYPMEIKPFYMKINDDKKTVRAMDILIPKVGEIIGGSQREDDPDILAARIKAQGIAPESLSWYMDLRKFGTVPHSGFGLGFERLVQFTTGMDNIRDVIPFPRTPGNLKP